MAPAGPVRAQAARRRLTVDSLTQVLPASWWSAVTRPRTSPPNCCSRRPCRRPDGPFKGRPKHPGLVIEALRQSQTDHRQVALATAELLDSLRHEPLPSLLFPERDEHDAVGSTHS